MTVDKKISQKWAPECSATSEVPVQDLELPHLLEDQ